MDNKILIVEDDESIMDVLKIILRKAGYETICFPNGKAVMQDDFEVPNLFLLDKQLSGIDGLDICRHLKENNNTKTIPVIMISANPQIGTLSIEAGADDYIEKPFTIDLLLSTIKSHMERKETAMLDA
jgi:DNA-binding response OmpR family regulator